MSLISFFIWWLVQMLIVAALAWAAGQFRERSWWIARIADRTAIKDHAERWMATLDDAIERTKQGIKP